MDVLHNHPVLLLFILIALGYLIGSPKIRGFSFGPVAGVLFAGLAFGHFGYRLSPDAQALGFALFIFSVGYQAGPRFFDVLKVDGLKYFMLALVIAVCGFTVASGAAYFLKLEPGTAAGLLAGGLTSSPTLAAAQEAIRTGAITPPDGWTADQVIGNISTGYAITYIFGLAGLIAIIKIAPALLKLDLVAMARDLDQQGSSPRSNDDENIDAIPPLTNHVCTRTYRITSEAATKAPAAEIIGPLWDGVTMGEIWRDGKQLPPLVDDLSVALKLGDELVLVGPAEFFIQKELQDLGEEIPTTSDLSHIESAQIVVNKSSVIGKKLEEFDIAGRYKLLLLHIHRSGIELPLTRGHVLHHNDILSLTGPADEIDAFGAIVGHVERDMPETDLVTFALGISVGIAVGMLSIKVFGMSIGLGSAGGMVAAGILVGFMRSISPTFGRLPEPARWLLMEFGLLLFMAGVGLRAGCDIVETFMATGPKLALAGVVVTFIPVIVGYVFGSRILKLNPVLLLGGITGSMTSGASLSIVIKAAQSQAPALGYAGAYAFANILLTIAGSLILL